MAAFCLLHRLQPHLDAFLKLFGPSEGSQGTDQEKGRLDFLTLLHVLGQVIH